jgi:hypothetical protein
MNDLETAEKEVKCWLAGLSLACSTQRLAHLAIGLDPQEPTKLSPGQRATFLINQFLALSETMRIILVQGSILNSGMMRWPQGE